MVKFNEVMNFWMLLKELIYFVGLEITERDLFTKTPIYCTSSANLFGGSDSFRRMWAVFLKFRKTYLM